MPARLVGALFGRASFLAVSYAQSLQLTRSPSLCCCACSADGKVCLSLLGTWHGGDESEKWRPGTSTLFQVLLSIQVRSEQQAPVLQSAGAP